MQETVKLCHIFAHLHLHSTDMPLLLEQTSDRGEWAVPCLQTGILILAVITQG